MTIGMDTIPGAGALRKPGVYSEIDNSKAVRGPQPVSYPCLMIPNCSYCLTIST